VITDMYRIVFFITYVRLSLADGVRQRAVRKAGRATRSVAGTRKRSRAPSSHTGKGGSQINRNILPYPGYRPGILYFKFDPEHMHIWKKKKLLIFTITHGYNVLQYNPSLLAMQMKVREE